MATKGKLGSVTRSKVSSKKAKETGASIAAKMGMGAHGKMPMKKMAVKGKMPMKKM